MCVRMCACVCVPVCIYACMHVCMHSFARTAWRAGFIIEYYITSVYKLNHGGFPR